jgi:LysR family glycine cleavage system transcriptional activator
MAVQPPRPRDIKLTALRAFEAAGRLGGFSAAASELGVTPGAITAHIKSLEDQIGARLFERTHASVELSALGERVLVSFTEAFDGLGAAVHNLRSETAPHAVHIATLPAIAQLWLSPRLPALRVVEPDISISITAMEAPPNLKRSPHDLCLFYSDEAEGQLAGDSIFPVCSPSVAAGLKSPEDLRHVTCLTDTAWADDWDKWSAIAMPGVAFKPRGPVFSLYTLAVEETVNGAGVLIGHLSLVTALLERGDLVEPFSTRIELARKLRLWSARKIRPNSPVWRVSRWLRDSA